MKKYLYFINYKFLQNGGWSEGFSVTEINFKLDAYSCKTWFELVMDDIKKYNDVDTVVISNYKYIGERQ